MNINRLLCRRKVKLLGRKLVRFGSGKVLTIDSINENIPKVEYAVRGELASRALNIESELKSGQLKPFKFLVKANTGDAQATGQPPLTWVRQITACCFYPQLLDSLNFPDDVRKRVCLILSHTNGRTTGSYSESIGLDIIRQHCAEFIEERDCLPADPNNIVLTNGATEGIKNVLKLFLKTVDCKPTGVMLSVPQYPLYSATFTEVGLINCGYYLNEEQNWSVDACELHRSYKDFSGTATIRAIVVINPGNPTGQVLSPDNIKMILQFAYEKKMVVIADEVYQDNINYPNEVQFHSFKKVLASMGNPFCNEIELVSFYSISKGYSGECGSRGGYAEFVNFDPAIVDQVRKLVSCNLCGNIAGQIQMSAVVRPPQPGDESFARYDMERKMILSRQADNAALLYELFNSTPGFSCNKIMGAIYGFPRIMLPNKARERAKECCRHPDVYYCLELLEETGICFVPGSGFGQFPGTFHLRCTTLPPKDHLKSMIKKVKDFNEAFTKRYA